MNPSVRLKGCEALVWRFMMKRKRLKCINSGNKTILKGIFAGNGNKSRERNVHEKDGAVVCLIYSNFCLGRS